jgi:ketopantoate reductase
MQHSLTQTVAAPASAQGALELMTIWACQNASLRHSTDATEFMTQLIAEAETVFFKYSQAVSAVRKTRDEDEA